MPASSPILGTPSEQRAGQLARITHRRDELLLSASSLESLANMIENTDCPVETQRPTWLSVARRIREDVDQLMGRVRQSNDRIEQLQWHLRAESSFGPSPFPVQPPQGTPDLHSPEWMASASKLDLEQALIRATNIPFNEQDAVLIRMLTERMDMIDGIVR